MQNESLKNEYLKFFSYLPVGDKCHGFASIVEFTGASEKSRPAKAASYVY